MLRLTSLLALAWLALAPAAAAQLQLSPADHLLLVPQGKSATIKVSVTDDCTPTWSFDVAAASFFDVQGDDPGPAKSRSYKLTAQGPVGSFTNARIDAEGVGPACSEDASLLVRLLIVAKGKNPTKQLVGGDKKLAPPVVGLAKRFKAFRQASAQARKALASDVKEILAKHEAQVFLQPQPGGQLSQSELAMYRYMEESADTLDDLYQTYAQTLDDMATDGALVLDANGFQANSIAVAAPADFQPGSGGAWDTWRRRLADELIKTGRAFGDAEQKFLVKLRKQAIDRGEPFFVTSSYLDLPDPGEGQLSPVSGAGQPGLPDLATQKTAAILRVSGTNQAALGGFFLASGRLQIHGRVGNTDTIIVTFQRLDVDGTLLGDVQGEVVEVDPDDDSFRITWPDVDAPANLAPGTWRVAVSGGGSNVVSRLVTIPGN